MSSETSNVSVSKTESPNYKVIAEQIGALMAAGKQSGMDQDTIRAAIHVFGSVSNQPQVYTGGHRGDNLCSEVRKY